MANMFFMHDAALNVDKGFEFHDDLTYMKDLCESAQKCKKCLGSAVSFRFSSGIKLLQICL